MDFFVSLHLKPKQLKALNRCWVYLQVLFFSDISSAYGLTILPNYIHGHRATHWTSSFDWPHQPCPPALAWRVWANTLAPDYKREIMDSSWRLDTTDIPAVDAICMPS
jgi:hypothetical protein